MLFLLRWRRRLLLSLAPLLLAQSAAALPRYAAHYGQKCLLCHDDPSGGGRRSAYASQYLVPSELALRTPADAAAIDPQLNERIAIGVDLRTLYRYHPDAARKSADNLFQMQGDLYVQLQVDARVSLHLEQSLSGAGEVYGLAFLLPAGGYLKAGRFAPAFGWRFADHTQVVRERAGFAPPADLDVGVEVGLLPSGAGLSLGIFNGAGGQLRDSDNRPALALRGEWRRELAALKLGLGASLYREEEAAAGRERRLGGPFACVALGPLTWLGECDWERRERAEGGPQTALLASQELCWTLRRGCALRALFDFHDPDASAQSGSERRFAIGAELLATPFVGVSTLMSWWDAQPGPAVGATDYEAFSLILHLLY
ncbi:hypothetical protein FJ251_01665 [bacterium]|nr:hypothetical protein [bacterium]